MRPRTEEILSSDLDWHECLMACRAAEREHAREASALWPQWSTFESGLTDIERAWFEGPIQETGGM